MSATTMSQRSTNTFEATLKLWGFNFKRDARKSHIFSVPSAFHRPNANGQIMREFPVSKGRNINEFQLQEVCNLLNVTPDEFWAGPALMPESQEEQPAPEISVSAPSTNGSTPAVVKRVTKDKPINMSRIHIIHFLDSLPDKMIADPSGFASRNIVEYMLQHDHPLTPQGVVNILKAMAKDNQIVRDVRGKRTYSILLNLNDPFVKVTLERPVQQTLIEPVPVIQPEPESPEIEVPQEVVDRFTKPQPASQPYIDYDLLAEHVVERLAYLLSRPARENQLHNEIDTLKERLHRATEYSQSLRRQLERYMS